MKIFFCADTRNNEANQKLRACIKRYGQADLAEADVVIALGGDGFMLKTLQMLLNYQTPVFGLNFGHVGHLLNHYAPDNLQERVATAEKVHLTPLIARAESFSGQKIEQYAFNDFSLMRQSPQAARLSATITDEQNGRPIILQDTVFGDGIIVATQSGSEGYYASAGGRPFVNEAESVGVKGVCCKVNYNPVVTTHAHIYVTPQEPKKRPIHLDCDGKKRFANIAQAVIECDANRAQTLLIEHRSNNR